MKRNHPEIAVRRLNGEGVAYAARIDVAKENFGIRPAIIMDPIDRLIYQALVDHFSLQLIGELHPSVYGWRLRRRKPRRGHYSNQQSEWRMYRRHLKNLALVSHGALKTDVVSCFASVSIDRLAEDILQRKANQVSKRLIDMLRGFDAIHKRSGLAQRSAASAVLANFFLDPLDEVLNAYRSVSGFAARLAPRGKAVRWMDDIWLFGKGGRLRKAQVDLQERMLDLGLNMNLGKTSVVEGDDLWTEVNRIEHSAVDAGLASREMTLEPLDELIDELLDDPASSERTSVRFVTTRMRQHGIYDRVGEFVDAAHLMPHASDALSRLFRDSEAWRDLQQWFVKYARGSWGRIDWSVAQYGTMFPTTAQPDPGVVEFLTEELPTTSSQALASLAAQRIATWSPPAAREAIHEASTTADNPVIRRTLALAGLTARLRRSEIREVLSEFRENQVTLSMLEDTGFKSPKVKSDFEGG